MVVVDDTMGKEGARLNIHFRRYCISNLIAEYNKNIFNEKKLFLKQTYFTFL